MRARRLVPILALAVLGAAAAARFESPSQAAVSSTLHASVGPDFDISLRFDDGTPAATAPAGTYRVAAIDQSPDHDFHLFGPGVNVDTGVEPVGTTGWTVTLQSNSRYIFQCDVHPDSMSGILTVGTPADTTPSAPPPSGTGSVGNTGAADPFLGSLSATVTAGKVKLLRAGKPVSRLTQGRYRIAVSDASRRDGLTLRQVGGGLPLSLAGVAFVGHHTSTVDLKAGQWKYYPTGHEAAGSVFFRVSAK
jgi:hypothetical protein